MNRGPKRLGAHPRSPALGPMADHVMSPAGAVADPPIERLDRKPALRAPRHERVESTAEPIDFDDVAGRDAFKAHGQHDRTGAGPRGAGGPAPRGPVRAALSGTWRQLPAEIAAPDAGTGATGGPCGLTPCAVAVLSPAAANADCDDGVAIAFEVDVVEVGAVGAVAGAGELIGAAGAAPAAGAVAGAGAGELIAAAGSVAAVGAVAGAGAAGAAGAAPAAGAVAGAGVLVGAGGSVAAAGAVADAGALVGAAGAGTAPCVRAGVAAARAVLAPGAEVVSGAACALSVAGAAATALVAAGGAGTAAGTGVGVIEAGCAAATAVRAGRDAPGCATPPPGDATCVGAGILRIIAADATWPEAADCLRPLPLIAGAGEVVPQTRPVGCCPSRPLITPSILEPAPVDPGG